MSLVFYWWLQGIRHCLVHEALSHSSLIILSESLLTLGLQHWQVFWWFRGWMMLHCLMLTALKRFRQSIREPCWLRMSRWGLWASLVWVGITTSAMLITCWSRVVLTRTPPFGHVVLCKLTLIHLLSPLCGCLLTHCDGCLPTALVWVDFAVPRLETYRFMDNVGWHRLLTCHEGEQRQIRLGSCLLYFVVDVIGRRSHIAKSLFSIEAIRFIL